MRRFIKKNSGITLIALVITIIVLLILAGISIASLTGDNWLISRAVSAKNSTILTEAREKIKLAVMDSYIEGNGKITYESLKTALGKNFKGEGTEVDYYEIVEGNSTTSSWKVRVHTSAGDVDELITSDGKIDDIINGDVVPTDTYQWRVVADNDNNGKISLGDEVEPVIASIKNEHFYVVDLSSIQIELLSKYCVDPTSNSQSTNAAYVTYDEVYDTGSQGEKFIMQEGSVKSSNYVEGYFDSNENGEEIWIEGYWSYEYYGQDELGTLVSEGRCTRNYENRFTVAGMNLLDVRQSRT